MSKRFRAPVAPTPLKGRGEAIPDGKASHIVRVMHRECVTRTTRDRFKLRAFAFAAVEYRGTRPSRVLGASDDALEITRIAAESADAFTALGDHAHVRPLRTCRAFTKKRAGTTRQEVHVADIDRVRECRACGSKEKTRVCKPRRATTNERTEATQELARLKAARA